MADALRQYWYLGIALIVAVILTLWVIKKARRHRAGRTPNAKRR